MEENKIIALKDYENIANANLDSEVLKQNGIENFLGEQDVVKLFPMFKEINEGLKIYVFEKDFERAIRLLKDYHSTDAK